MPYLTDFRDQSIPRTLAYEELGYHFDQSGGVTAQEALSRFGEYDIHLEPLSTQSGINVEHNAIILGGRTPKVFGVVSPYYELISPQQTVQMWDDQAGVKVRGIASLRQGKELMLTAELPTTNVLGDEIKHHLYLLNSFDASTAIRGVLSSVRMYCTNQLPSIRRSAEETLAIRHRKDAEGNLASERLRDWLDGIYQRFVQRSFHQTEVYERLARRQVRPNEFAQALVDIYRDPEPLAPEQRQDEEQTRRWEVQRDLVRDYRTEIANLFNGEGRGSMTPACHHTAFGLVNVIAEFEDRRRNPGRNSVRSIAASSLFGERAETKQRALERILELVA